MKGRWYMGKINRLKSQWIKACSCDLAELDVNLIYEAKIIGVCNSCNKLLVTHS